MSSVLPDSKMWWHNRNSVHQQACTPHHHHHHHPREMSGMMSSCLVHCLSSVRLLPRGLDLVRLLQCDRSPAWTRRRVYPVALYPSDLTVRPWELHSRRPKSDSTAVTLMKNLRKCSRRHCWKSMKKQGTRRISSISLRFAGAKPSQISARLRFKYIHTDIPTGTPLWGREYIL